MESMMTLNRRSFAWVFSISPSWTFPATPGMREAIRCMGAIPVSMSICSYISWRVNFPAMIFLVSSSAFFSSIASWAFSRRGGAARRVDDEDARPFEGLEACPHDAARVLPLPVPVEAHLDLVRELLELVVRRGPVDVRRDEADGETLLLEVLPEQ